MSRRFDLHTHSMHSDGTTTPAEIAQEAAELGLAGFALTDHDTAQGWNEAREAATKYGIEFLPGMELTTRHEWRSTHLLAYGLDPELPELVAELDRVRDSRVHRAREIVERLSADFTINWQQLHEETAGRTIGRPHIADALVEAGHFATRSEVFADVLNPGSPYYVPTYAIETLDAIELVRQAGGVAVLAHPAAARQSRPVDPAALAAFAEAGLWGIELEHPEHRPDWEAEVARLNERHGLHVTGASDYHGAGKPNRLGERTSSEQTWQTLRELVAHPN